MKFKKVFDTPFEQYSTYHGKTFTVVRELRDNEYNREANDGFPMYRIRFEDGVEIEAFAEEVELRWGHYNTERKVSIK